MATFSDRIRIIIDVVGDGATKGLDKFRQDLKNTDGRLGKFKVAAAGAFDYVKANAAEMGLAVGAAAVTVGVKSVMAFQDAALAAGEFSDATDMSAEASSRWLAATGEFGIELNDLSDAFNNVAGKIAEGDDVFDELGATIVRAHDGAVDMDATMRNVVEAIAAIEDPALKAKIAAELLGEEGTRQFAVLTGEAGRLTRKLEEVGDGRIFDGDAIDSAREFRDALQDIQEKADEAQYVIGQELVESLLPVVEAADGVAEGLGNVDDKLLEIGENVSAPALGFRLFAGSLNNLVKGPLAAFGPGVDTATGKIGNLEGTSDDAAEAVADIGEAADTAATEVETAGDRIEARWGELVGTLTVENALLDIQDGWDEIAEAFEEAADKSGKSAREQQADARRVERAINDQKLAVEEFGDEILNLPPQQRVKIQALIDQGKWNQANNLLEQLTRTRTVNLLLNATPLSSVPIPKYVQAPGPAAGPTVINNFPQGTRPTDVRQSSRRYDRVQGAI